MKGFLNHRMQKITLETNYGKIIISNGFSRFKIEQIFYAARYTSEKPAQSPEIAMNSFYFLILQELSKSFLKIQSIKTNKTSTIQNPTSYSHLIMFDINLLSRVVSSSTFKKIISQVSQKYPHTQKALAENAFYSNLN